MNKLIIANWKMNTTFSDALILANGIKKGLHDISGADVVLCPPFPWLVPVAEALHQHPAKQLKLGAQNAFWTQSGAYTGEVSPVMLKGLVEYVIIGHSERRKHFQETDLEIGAKLKAVLDQGMKPILCVGEQRRPADAYLDEPETLNQTHFREMFSQIRHALHKLTDEEKAKLVVAYEPVWAISTTSSAARPATGSYAAYVCQAIHALLNRLGGAKLEVVPVLYGGSVKSANAREFLSQESIDGLLVGGASLDIRSFLAICRSTY